MASGKYKINPPIPNPVFKTPFAHPIGYRAGRKPSEFDKSLEMAGSWVA